jgi:hypothetical protein
VYVVARSANEFRKGVVFLSYPWSEVFLARTESSTINRIFGWLIYGVY